MQDLDARQTTRLGPSRIAQKVRLSSDIELFINILTDLAEIPIDRVCSQLCRQIHLQKSLVNGEHLRLVFIHTYHCRKHIRLVSLEWRTDWRWSCRCRILFRQTEQKAARWSIDFKYSNTFRYLFASLDVLLVDVEDDWSLCSRRRIFSCGSITKQGVSFSLHSSIQIIS